MNTPEDAVSAILMPHEWNLSALDDLGVTSLLVWYPHYSLNVLRGRNGQFELGLGPDDAFTVVVDNKLALLQGAVSAVLMEEITLERRIPIA